MNKHPPKITLKSINPMNKAPVTTRSFFSPSRALVRKTPGVPLPSETTRTRGQDKSDLAPGRSSGKATPDAMQNHQN